MQPTDGPARPPWQVSRLCLRNRLASTAWLMEMITTVLRRDRSSVWKITAGRCPACSWSSLGFPRSTSHTSPRFAGFMLHHLVSAIAVAVEISFSQDKIFIIAFSDGSSRRCNLQKSHCFRIVVRLYCVTLAPMSKGNNVFQSDRSCPSARQCGQ